MRLPLSKTLLLALTAAVVVAAAWWALRDSEPAASAARSTAAAPGQSDSPTGRPAAIGADAEGPPSEGPGPGAPTVQDSPSMANARPPAGVSAEQWAQVQAQLQGRPDADAELFRLREYFEFSDQARRLREWRQQGRRGAEGQALARAVDQGLDQRLLRRELQAAEARGLKLVVLEQLVDDPAERQQRLQAWAAGWNARLAADPQLQASRARDEEFTRRQQQLVAAWSALPPSQRSVQRLEQDIAALRAVVYRTAPR